MKPSELKIPISVKGYDEKAVENYRNAESERANIKVITKERISSNNNTVEIVQKKAQPQTNSYSLSIYTIG